MDEELERLREAKREKLRKRVEQERQGTESPSQPVSATGPEHFATVLDQHPIALVDFYADWCGPCQMLAPTLERIAADTAATAVKVDTDAHPQLAQEHGVRGLPTLVLFVDGAPVERLVGAQTESTLRSVIDRAVDAQ